MAALLLARSNERRKVLPSMATNWPLLDPANALVHIFKAALQRLRIHGGKHPLKCVARGDSVGQLEKAAKLLLLGSAKGCHTTPILCAANHRAQRDHHDIGQQMPASPPLAWILKAFKLIPTRSCHRWSLRWWGASLLHCEWTTLKSKRKASVPSDFAVALGAASASERSYGISVTLISAGGRSPF